MALSSEGVPVAPSAADPLTGWTTVSSMSSVGVAAQQAGATNPADSLGTDIQFDYNQDGQTTQEDWEAYLNDLLKITYTAFEDDDRTAGRGPSMQEKINGDVRDESGATVSDLDISGIHSYYLNNVGQATSVKRQAPWNDCWSFAVISALESSMLKARAGAAGQAVNPADHVTPKLENIDDHGLDLSELYFAWLAHNYTASGSQKGEGLSSQTPNTAYADDWEARLNAGSLSLADYLFGAWRGIADESDIPYLTDELKAYLKNYVDTKDPSHTDLMWQFADPLTKDVFKQFHPVEPSEQVGVPQVAHVNGVVYLPSPNRTTVQDGKVVWAGHDDNADMLIKQALVKYGAVAVSIYSGGPHFNYTTGGWYNDQTNCRTDHAVTIVGWNDDIDPSVFQTYVWERVGDNYVKCKANDVSGLGKGAWLVKNSWGSEDWCKEVYGRGGFELGIPTAQTAEFIKQHGDQLEDYRGTGYYWVSYYDRTLSLPMCFSVDDGLDGFDYQHNYSYDTATIANSTPFALRTDDDGTLVANVFEADTEQVLKAVSVRTNQPNSHAKIYIYLVNSGGLADNDPTNDGEAVLSFDFDATLSGLHTVALPTPIQLKKGQLFAVVENVTSEEASGQRLRRQSWLNLETEVSQKLQDANPAADSYYRSILIANDGETFARVKTASGYRWVTPKQLTEAILDGRVMEFGSAMVKAFTVDASSSSDQPTPTQPSDDRPSDGQTDDHQEDSHQTGQVASTMAIWRLYNHWDGDHLFTTDQTEYDHLATIGWTQEGVAWRSPSSGNAVYRLYNPYSGEHLYTRNASERDSLVSIGWNYEGVSFYTQNGGGSPIYRLYNRWLTVGTHLYTVDETERANLVRLGWQDEGESFRTADGSLVASASDAGDAPAVGVRLAANGAPRGTLVAASASSDALLADAPVAEVAGADERASLPAEVPSAEASLSVEAAALDSAPRRPAHVLEPGRLDTETNEQWVPTSWVSESYADDRTVNV